MKIDLTTIEGYADMSAEDKIKALEGFEFDDNSDALAKALSDVEKYKGANSKANSEIAEMKRKTREQMSADEKARLEQEENIQRIINENELLKREKSIIDNKAKFLSLGYDEALAEKTANALVDGDMETVFANQKAHMENTEKRIKAELLKDSPKIDSRDSGGIVSTKKDFLALDTQGQLEYMAKNPNWKSDLK